MFDDFLKPSSIFSASFSSSQTIPLQVERADSGRSVCWAGLRFQLGAVLAAPGYAEGGSSEHEVEAVFRLWKHQKKQNADMNCGILHKDALLVILAIQMLRRWCLKVQIETIS